MNIRKEMRDARAVTLFVNVVLLCMLCLSAGARL